ncbi:MAG: dipeptidyl carboxypeptidase II, partial [Gammaproteobacteria bacterium]
MTSFKPHKLTLAGAAVILASACSDSDDDQTSIEDAMDNLNIVSSADAAANPFYTESPLPLKYPPFDQISNEHYMPAFERGMAEHLEEIAAIVNSGEDPTFENTIVALELSGQSLDRVATVFFALSSAHTNDEIDAIEVEVSPKLSAHTDSIYLDAELFARVQVIYDQRDSLGLDAESIRLVEEYHKNFVRAGARLDVEQKEELKAINLELSELSTSFSQNV